MPAADDQKMAALKNRQAQLLVERHKRQNELAEFTKSHPELSSAVPEIEKATAERLAALTQAFTAAQLDATQAKAALDATAPMLADPPKAADLIEINRPKGIFSSLDAHAQQIQAELAQVQPLLEQQKQTMLPQNPARLATARKVEEIQLRLDAEQKRYIEVYRTYLEQQWQTALHKQEELQRLIDQQKTQSAGGQASSNKIFQLRAAYKQAQDALDAVDAQISNISLRTVTGLSNVRLEQPASPAAKPTWPIRTKVMLLALSAGLVVGLLAALVAFRAGGAS
jgi:hypothetical protein